MRGVAEFGDKRTDAEYLKTTNRQRDEAVEA